MNKIFAFCGASGTGKSTLLKYIKENYNIEVKELSGRDFLPKDNSYDKTLTDEIQTKIVYNRAIETAKALADLTKDKSIVFSRSNLDTLSYSLVLHKAESLNDLQKKEIESLKDYIIYFYLPVEFDMKDENDIVRGTNKDVQRDTDKNIRLIINQFNLWNHVYTLTGSVKERTDELDEIFSKYGVNRIEKFNKLKL